MTIGVIGLNNIMTFFIGIVSGTGSIRGCFEEMYNGFTVSTLHNAIDDFLVS